MAWGPERGVDRAAGLPNESTATGSGASMEIVYHRISSAELLIALESVHYVGRTRRASQNAMQLRDASRHYGAVGRIRKIRVRAQHMIPRIVQPRTRPRWRGSRIQPAKDGLDGQRQSIRSIPARHDSSRMNAECDSIDQSGAAIDQKKGGKGRVRQARGEE